MNYERGSEWRRWDLHIHTPGTNKNDNFNGKNEHEKWLNYYTAIDNYVGDGKDPLKAISVMGITDYLSIANYKKVIKDNKLPNCIKLVIPNVEMRITPISSKSAVNIHFLFDPNIEEELEARFFARLNIRTDNTNYSAVKKDLIRLGKTININYDDVKAYKEGVNQFVPNLDCLQTIFDEDKDLRAKTIIAISNNTADGVSGVVANKSYLGKDQSSQLDTVRKNVYKFADFVFSSQPSDISYFLGLGVDDENKVKNKCGSLMPCIHGSDAHELKKVFEPDENKYCWIKANPTFNGLKQVLYEPKDRVCISSIIPESKPDYHVIKAVKFKNDEFSEEPIVFNDKLTCIIGGKSTGKSLLLQNLASAIDEKQVVEKINITKLGSKRVSDIKVYWADGECGVETTDKIHKIVYIPQSYLNRLSESNEETTEIDKIIKDIVLSSDKARKSYKEMEEKLSIFKPKIDKKIYDLIQVNKFIEEKINEEKELGSFDGIEKEIKKLQIQKINLSKKFSLSSDEIDKYDVALDNISKIENGLNLIENDIIELEKTITLVSPIDITDCYSNKTEEKINEAIKNAILIANASWTSSRSKILNLLKEEKREKTKTLEEYKSIRDRIGKLISGNESIVNLTKAIEKEKGKLIKYKKVEIEKKQKEKEKTAVINYVASVFDEFDSIHNKYANDINDNLKLESEGLEFTVRTPFRSEAFLNMMQTLFDKRTLKAKKEILDIEDFDIQYFSKENLRELILASINGELPIVKNQTLEYVLRSIINDWYNTTYNVKMDNDTIEEMSPGKKALVLLKLLIDMADSKCPILIDQPEDDLDNRSIYEDLIPFIKLKKIQRQIIIVTHNANVVLGGDAEEIIIANQNGNNSNNNEFRFEYRAGAIEEDLPIYDKQGKIKAGILYQQGIQQHICDILEGGEKAFDLRKHKYQI
ncbi:MAG: hypothetical protein JJE03_00025 [Peptostreptococcaceae bacterium]|nr:hypothetical protein [Peptostreptococcaceae bacterium]